MMKKATHALWLLSSALLGGLILVTCIDVVGRYLLNRPFDAAFELTQLLLGALVFAALPLTTMRGQHVEVDLLVHLLPRRVNRALAWFGASLMALTLVYFAWRLVLVGHDQQLAGTRSNSLGLPLAPLAYAGALSCLASAAVAIGRRKE